MAEATSGENEQVAIDFLLTWRSAYHELERCDELARIYGFAVPGGERRARAVTDVGGLTGIAYSELHFSIASRCACSHSC